MPRSISNNLLRKSLLNVKLITTLLLALFCKLRAQSQSMLDPTFGNNGLLSPIYNNSDEGGVTYMNISSSGNFYAIAAGSIVKYNEGGDVIASFGNNGWFDNPYYLLNTYPHYYSPGFIIEQPNGGLIAGGSFYNDLDTTYNDLFLFKTESNGQGLDSNFGTNGLVTLDISFQDDAYCMAQQSDGKIIVGGACASTDTLLLVRVKIDGILDSSFGVNGIVKTVVGQWTNAARSISVLNNGKILVGARAYNLVGDYDFTVLRYNSDGTLDMSFNNTGIAFGNANGTGLGLLADMQVQADNKILVTGGSSVTSDGFLVLRLNEDGTKDTTFNNTGIQMIDIDGSGNASKLALQQTGKIVIGGRYYTSPTEENWGLMRITTDGALDTGFGDSGLVRLPLGDRQERIQDLKIQPDEKILACGYYETGTWPNINAKMMIARFLKNGNTFVKDHLKQTNVICYPNPADDVAYIESDKKLLAVEISDILGKRLSITDVKNEKVDIPTDQLPDGIYFLRATLKDRTIHTEKLVIQHH